MNLQKQPQAICGFLRRVIELAEEDHSKQRKRRTGRQICQHLLTNTRPHPELLAAKVYNSCRDGLVGLQHDN